MKVKVGAVVYDSERTPIMLILTDGDKRNILEMLPECSKYASFPEGSPPDEIERWMNDVPNDKDEVPT